MSGEVPTNLFHRVAELLSGARLQFQMALEAGKLPAAGFPSRRRGPGACVESTLRAAVLFNSSLYRLVGNLSTKPSLNLLFDEATKVKLLAKVLLDSLSMSFWLLSALLH